MIPIDVKLMETMVGGGVSGGVSDAVNDAITDAVNDAVIDGVNAGVKSGLIIVVSLVLNREGMKSDEISRMLVKGKRTAERYLEVLKKIKVIEFRGAPKTGGYYLTEQIKKKLTL